MLFLCAEGDGGLPPWVNWVFVAVLVVLVAALLIVPMFTNKKRAKQESERYNSLRPGDVIKTVGGIIGTVIEIRQVSPTEKELVIETGIGDNKTTMVFDIQALYQIVSKVPAPAVPVSDTADTAVADASTDDKAEATETAEAAPDAVENHDEPVVAQVADEQVSSVEQAANSDEVESSAPAEAAETAAVDDEPSEKTDETAATEEPVKQPAKKSGAGKSTHASKSTGAGKSSAKKPAKK